MSNSKRRIAIMVAVLLGGGLLAWGGYWLAVARPREAAAAERLVLQGDVEVREVDLAFKQPGQLATVRVDEGDSVRAGATLATLDASDARIALADAAARRAAAQAALQKAETGSRREDIGQARAVVLQRTAQARAARLALERARAAYPSGAISRQLYDQAEADSAAAAAALQQAREALNEQVAGSRPEDVRVARAQVAVADAAVAQRQQVLRDLVLTAPSAGVIRTRVRERGAVVAAGQPVFTLALTSPVWVRGYVDEPDLARARPGMAAEVRTDDGRRFTGKVGFVSPTAEFTPKTVETRKLRTSLVYRIRVVVERGEALRQGMPVTIVLRSPRARP